MMWSAVIITILVLLLGLSIYFNVKFGIMILQVQDSIEECLDVLDERYESISKILEIPLFYDSREVRTVLDDIRVSREQILGIARKIASIDNSAIEQEKQPGSTLDY